MDQTIEERVQSRSLTRSGRRIAQYILDNRSKVAFSSAGAIASELGVSDISVTRLCRALGFEGYQEMRTALREEVAQQIEEGERVLSPRDKLDQASSLTDESVIGQIASLSVRGINRLLQKNPEEKFDRITKRIYQCGSKVLLGARGAVGVIEFLHMSMSFVLPGVHKIISNDPNELNVLLDLTREDCLLVYSCSRYPAVTRFAMGVARRAGAYTVLITDMETSPLIPLADDYIIASGQGISHFSSPIVAMVAAEIINTKLARLAYQDENIASRFENMEEFTISSHFYIMTGKEEGLT